MGPARLNSNLNTENLSNDILTVRKKIDTIISKNEPIYDEDAPDCPESVRFLVFTGGSCVDREKVAIAGSSTVNVRTTPDMLGSLVEPTTTLPGRSAAATSGGAGAAGQLTLSSLVGVVNDCKDADKKKDEKKPTKKDKKEKKVKKEDPQTTKEKQQNGRNFHLYFKVSPA